MGFNIEQYEIGNAYSNISGNDALRGVGTICVKGSPVYGIPLTYGGFQMTKKGRAKISENRQICQARYATKQGSSEVTSTTSDMPLTTASNSSTSTPISVSATDGSVSNIAPKSNMGLYIGIGVGILAIGIVTIVLLTRKK